MVLLKIELSFLKMNLNENLSGIISTKKIRYIYTLIVLYKIVFNGLKN